MQRTNWKSNPERNQRYKTAEHRETRARWARLMTEQGFLMCAQPECLMSSRVINMGDKWHLGHDDAGSQYIGPTHARCNVVDGAKRGNRRSRGIPDKTPLRWVV